MFPLPILILIVLLAASVTGNAWLLDRLQGAQEAATRAESARDQALGAATTCNASVEALQAQAAARVKAADAARVKAQQAATTAQARAQQILATPASVPGDACKSAEQRVSRWLQARGKP